MDIQGIALERYKTLRIRQVLILQLCMETFNQTLFSGTAEKRYDVAFCINYWSATTTAEKFMIRMFFW
jgi:hypothetical protein